jgi:peptidyl-prolyl cis-trans isomerase D
MLQQIRDKITGWVAIVFLSVIAIVFIFWGVQFESSTNVAAATVNGEKIPVELVRRAWQDRQSELQQLSRDELPPELVQQEQQRILDDFIRRELLVQRAGQLGYRVSDRELAEALARIPALQVDGVFSRDRYAALLRAQGRTEADFEAEFRRDLQINQLSNAVAISAFALPGEVRRRVELALQYVQLSLSDVEGSIEVSDEALRRHYEEVAAERFQTTERRRARHILVEAGTDDAAARARAESLAERARAGEDFSTLAAQNSDDPGSKGQGGDLGWATRESFVAPFADALFGMAKGEVRGPVQTQFGYHVIKLDDLEAAHQRSFDEVRAELESDYRREQAQTEFYERSQQLADEAFASLNELESVAQQLGLETRAVEVFTRQGGGPFGAERKLIEAAFSDEVLQERQNSPAINVGEDSVVVLRVTEHRPPVQRPLDEVRGEIEQNLRAQRAREAAEAAARAAAARIAAGEGWTDVASSLGLQPMGGRSVTRTEETLPPELLQAVFTAAAPASGQVSSGVAALPGGDAALFVVSGMRPGSVSSPQAAADLAARAQRAAGQVALAEFSSYVAALERNAKITRNSKLFE